MKTQIQNLKAAATDAQQRPGPQTGCNGCAATARPSNLLKGCKVTVRLSNLRFQPSSFSLHVFKKPSPLVEVALALSVASFCFIPLLGLIPVGFSTNQYSVEQTKAASVAARIVADLHCTPSSSDTSALGFKISSTTPQIIYFTETACAPGHVGDALVTSGTAHPATVPRSASRLLPPARKASTVRIMVTWPAQADQTNTGWPTKQAGSFETVTALNRNSEMTRSTPPQLIRHFGNNEAARSQSKFKIKI